MVSDNSIESDKRETHKSTTEWERATFPGGDDLSPVHALRLLEEVVLVCRVSGATWIEITKTVRQLRPSFEKWEERRLDPEEAARRLLGCSIVLTDLAGRLEES